jgi:hypothetical protein
VECRGKYQDNLTNMWEQKGDDKGIWTEYVNSETGESSIKEHKPKVIWKSCKSFDLHDFKWTGNRELTCSKCGFIFMPIIGIHTVKDGKIIENSPK